MRTKDNKGIYSMRHTILRAAVCAFFAGAAMTASAANPFSDVENDSWAYEAVASLSDQNIVEGYPDGTFKGDKHIPLRNGADYRPPAGKKRLSFR